MLSIWSHANFCCLENGYWLIQGLFLHLFTKILHQSNLKVFADDKINLTVTLMWFSKGRKTLWDNDNMQMTSIFSTSRNILKRLLPQGNWNYGLCGKEFNIIGKLISALLVIWCFINSSYFISKWSKEYNLKKKKIKVFQWYEKYRDHRREIIKVISYSRWSLNTGSVWLIYEAVSYQNCSLNPLPDDKF